MAYRPYNFKVDLNQNSIFIRLNLETLHSRRNVLSSDRHSHAEYELHIVLEGAADINVEDGHYTLTKHQAMLLAPGQYHQPKALPGTFERFSLSFSLSEGPLLERMRRQIPSCHVFSISPEIESLCHSIFTECATKPPFWQALQTSQLSALFIYLFRLLQLDISTHPARNSTSELVRTDLIDNYFEQHFAQKAGLSDLADELHLSTRQVARVLLDHYGMGFQEKLNSTRMDHAAWLLRTTDLRISQVADSVGYASEAAFYQVFRNHFQVTPQNYRKQFLHRPASE